MNSLLDMFLFFIFYSMVGWLLEVIGKLIEDKKFINRGFLIGPICPIYGVGTLIIINIIGKPNGDVLSVLLKSILVCASVEYFTSYIMEKLFKARWWDYTRRKFNINGRICLENLIPFSIGSTIIIYFIQPNLDIIVSLLNFNFKLVLSIMLLVIFIIDNFISFFVMNKIKNQIKKTSKDNTEIIKEQIIEWFDNNSFIYRRIKSSYPNFKVKINDLKKNLEKTKNELFEKF